MATRLLATMVTTTSYGSWLPGDLRGYMEDGIVLPSNPERLGQAVHRMDGRASVQFTATQQAMLFDALVISADEFRYMLTDVSVESWHLHWIISHGFDPIATMVGRLKTRMRQALNVGRIWTESYYDSRLFTESSVVARREYVARHAGCRMSDGVAVGTPPPQSGGLTDIHQSTHPRRAGG